MERMEIVDTHCHLYLHEFEKDLPDVVKRAESEGVSWIYLPALDSAHHERMLDLERRYPGKCRAMIGLHPTYVKENYQSELDTIRQLLGEKSFAAVGEIGLDYYWDRSFDSLQKIAFKEQIGLAKEHGLPVVIHSRSSMDDCIDVLRSERDGLRGIFHCFSGTLQNAYDVIACGLMLGIGGVITYKNAGLAEVVAEVPMEHLVLETDAPYLTPVPHRGKRNESSYLKYIVAKIATVKQISEQEVCDVTTRNAKAVFS